MKRIQYNEIPASRETHADREPRKNLIKERAAGPSMNSGGSAPADMGGEPPDGRARGLPGEVTIHTPADVLFTFTLVYHLSQTNDHRSRGDTPWKEYTHHDHTHRLDLYFQRIKLFG